MKRSTTCLVLATMLALAACGSEEPTSVEPYDPEWDNSTPIQSGKADIIDFAEELKFDGEVKGNVDSKQVDLYKMTLTRGDTFTMTMDVTSGDLAPDFRLFFGTTVTIRSTSFDVTKTQLVKEYKVEDSGSYAVLVRAFRNRGEGDYRLSATCTGGPCNGEFEPDPEFEFGFTEVDDCMNEIADCALNSVRDQNPGDVDPEISSLIMFECIAAASTDGNSCKGVCDTEEADGLCGFWEEQLSFFADGGNDCIDTFNDCWSDCADLGADSFSDSFDDNHHWVCTETGFNGTCLGFAQAHESCGGKLKADDEPAVCMMRCWAVDGAWIDDLDTICDEECFDCDDACFERIDNL